MLDVSHRGLPRYRPVTGLFSTALFDPSSVLPATSCSPWGNVRRVLTGLVPVQFVFLRPFAPPALPGFIATMDALTPVRPLTWHPDRSLHLSHAPFQSFSLQPHPGRHASSIGSPWTVADSPLARQASPIPSRLALPTCRIEFTLVRDQPSASGCSPPRLATTQLPPAASRSLPARGI